MFPTFSSVNFYSLYFPKKSVDLVGILNILAECHMGYSFTTALRLQVMQPQVILIPKFGFLSLLKN